MNLKQLLVLATATSVVVGKNVIDLAALKAGVENEVGDKRMENLDRRDAKNVYNFEDIRQAVVAEDSELTKRKNIVDLSSFKTAVEGEKSHNKRDAKNVFDITAFKEAYEGEKSKRSDRSVLFKVDVTDCHENILQSILPQLRSISLFTSYIREYREIEAKTELTNETMIIIAPVDEAIATGLNGLKPWEFPSAVEGSEEERDAASRSNLQSFVDHHVIVNFEQNLKLQSDANVLITKLNSGGSIRIKQDTITDEFAVQLVKEGNSPWIKVETVKQVDNGFVFLINDILVKPEN